MIGRLQSNKIKYLVNKVTLIHSVAELKLLEALNEQAIKNNIIFNILLQINPSLEESKQGLDENELNAILEIREQFTGINIQGLMCMAPLSEDEMIIRDTFLKAKSWYDKYQINSFKYLSMGMSNDYIIALQCGSNMIRVGSLIFEKK